MSNPIRDSNVTHLDSGKYAALLGDAAQLIVAGLMMKLGFDVCLACPRGRPYDLVIIAYDQHKRHVPLRAQVKTIHENTIRFVAGTRAGIDREYIPGVKEYTYTTQHNDLIIGFDPNNFDLYLIPTSIVEQLKVKSSSLRRFSALRNNWEILLNWSQEKIEELKTKILRGGSMQLDQFT